MRKFFYKYWWFYYVLLFILIGWLIYSLMWKPLCEENIVYIHEKIEVAPEVNDPINIVVCNTEVKSGGQGRTTTTHELGRKAGQVYIEYDMDNIPDKMEVFYNGQLVATTRELVSNQGSLNFYYSAKPNEPNQCKVEMSAPEEGTAWQYRLNCPQ